MADVRNTFIYVILYISSGHLLKRANGYLDARL